MSSHLQSILSLGFSIDAIKCDATNYHDFKQHIGLPRKNKLNWIEFDIAMKCKRRNCREY